VSVKLPCSPNHTPDFTISKFLSHHKHCQLKATIIVVDDTKHYFIISYWNEPQCLHFPKCSMIFDHCERCIKHNSSHSKNHNKLFTTNLLAFIMHCLFLHFRKKKSIDKLSNNLLWLRISTPTTSRSSCFPCPHFSQNFIT